MATKLIGSFVGVVLAAILATAAPAAAQVVTLHIESPIPAPQPTSMSMLIFRDEVARLSGGKIIVEVVPDSTRGTLKEVIDAVHVGSIFGTWMSVSNFSRLIPESAVVGIPFVFKNHDEARRAIIAGPVGSLIASKFEAKGFTLLTWMDGGAFNVSNSKRPLKTLDDFKGLTLRVMANAIHEATFHALGVQTVSMDLKDVVTALRQGDVDGAEQEYAIMSASKYFESQKYLTDTTHFLDFYVFITNKRAFASLDPAQQRIIRQAAETMSLREQKISEQAQAKALAQLQAAGMQFDPLSDETRAALRHATSGVVSDLKKWIGADVVNQVLAANRLTASDLHR